MKVVVDIPGTDPQGRVYLTWVPVQATLRLIDGPGAGAVVGVTLRNAGPGGQLLFGTTRTHHNTSTLALSLPGAGAPVAFWVGGEFGKPSSVDGDAVIEVVEDANSSVLASKRVMVRVRKSAQDLSAAERDGFLAALGTLNGRGMGRFSDFRDMHVASALRELHGNVGFLPWHRAYLLDLERELQNIDPAVALPYWRFDKPAPALFTTAFLGASGAADRVSFTPGHPLEFWTTDLQLGIVRSVSFPIGGVPSLLNETDTLALGETSGLFGRFTRMEGNPHGRAHTSFDGPVSIPATAPRDPLFFLLHTNVDRLWAKWQWLVHRTDPREPRAYANPSPDRIGHRIDDSMWPWNGVMTPPRPSTAPGGTLATSIVTAAPGSTPVVRSMIDFQGIGDGTHLGFAYDDVPFEAATPPNA